MSRYSYKIDDENAVKVWDSENPNEENAPFFFQPDQPDGIPWANKAEAEAWAIAFIAELDTPEELDTPSEQPLG